LFRGIGVWTVEELRRDPAVDCGGTPHRPSSRTTPQEGLDLRSKVEEVASKMVRRRGSNADDLEGSELTSAVDFASYYMRCIFI